MKIFVCSMLVVVTALCASTFAQSQGTSDLPPGSPQLVNPDDLVRLLQSKPGEKPLVLNVGPSILFMQAHIPGAEFIGATSDKQGLERLRTRVKPLPHDKFIVLYCGCCPWNHCPNVRPAYNELHAMGFTNIKVLYVANNFGADWVDKGYPTIKGQ